MPTLLELLTATADEHGHRPAVRLGGTTLTYVELRDLASQAAGLMQSMGVRPGDRVGLMMPNCIAFPVLYYGILWAGAIVVPMNPMLKGREISHYVADSGMEVCFVDVKVEEQHLSDVGGCQFIGVDDEWLFSHIPTSGRVAQVGRTGEDTAVVLYTSGTTGAPKGAELTHDNLARNAMISSELSSTGPNDVIMGCLPLFHAFGQTSGLNSAVRSGAMLTMVPKFEAEQVLSVIERDRVTIFLGVPTMYTALLGEGRGLRDLSALRLCVSGGASLPGEVLKEFRESFGAEILEGYGLSETSPTATFNRPGQGRVGSVGTPIEGVELQVVAPDGTPLDAGDVGEVVIRGHNVMKAYWRNPSATADAIRDGWFHTGDLGRLDEDGYLYIVDRYKDLIIRGGYNVYPREIEEVLYEHPDVLEAAVVPVPHDVLGQEIGAAVTLRPGSEMTETELREHVKAQVAAYKYPRVIWFVDALPKGATGKILKRDVVLPGAVEHERPRSPS